jgi:hypothetical protein
MWECAMRIQHLNEYLPDGWDTARKVERVFFFTIFSTMAPDYLGALTNESRFLRVMAKQEKATSQPNGQFMS